MTAPAPTTQGPSILAPLDGLDLGPAKKRLVKEGWNVEDVEAAAAEYLKFLALTREYPDEELVPCHDVDELWHAHILHTKRYEDDCTRYVGFFVHHDPDEVDEEGAAPVGSAGTKKPDRTLELYERHFGKPPAMWDGPEKSWVGVLLGKMKKGEKGGT
jgi:hypothetical protein